FHKHGYGAVLVDQIITASGLPKATFYANYSTKSKLGCAWLERLSKRMAVMNQNFLARPGEKDRRLRKYFYAMRGWLEANGFRSCQFANTAACSGEIDEDIAFLIDQYKRAQRAFFIDLVKTLVPEKDATRIGTAVFLLYSGAMTEAQN